MIQKRHDESELDYHRRLIYGKLVDKTLGDYDYTELAEAAYGKKLSPDVARRMFYGSRITLDILGEFLESGETDVDLLREMEHMKVELEKGRRRFCDQRNAYKKLITARARQEELNDIIAESIANTVDMPALAYTDSNPVVNTDNDLLVSLNDIHYGANCDNFWNVYNSDVCRKMFIEYIDKILNIAETHNSENCIVWMNGDAISGNIHQSLAVTNKENLIEQITGVSELIAEFLAILSVNFKTVRFVSVSGNHSRIDPNKERSLTSERLDDMVSWYLEARLQSHDNVYVNDYVKLDDTMYVMDIRGKVYCGVHGDFDPSPMKLLGLKTMTGVDLYSVLLAHKHHNKLETVHGMKVVMAGSMLGMDDYCVRTRIYAKPEQLVCVCDDKGIRCSYDILFEEE